MRSKGSQRGCKKTVEERGTLPDVIQQEVESSSSKHGDMDHGLCGSTSGLARSHLSAAWRLVTKVKRVRAALKGSLKLVHGADQRREAVGAM